MNTTLRKFTQTGFTLVELLIVVIILAILAAIVIPQFSSSAAEAREAALDANLATMRSAIELYRVQHGGVYPGARTAVTTGVACSPGTTGSGTATGGAGDTASQAMIEQLSTYSNAAGGTCNAAQPAASLYRYGPYLRKGIPNDPIGGTVGSSSTGIITIATGVYVDPTAATGGWAYDTVSGQIVMNSNATDVNAKAYSKH